MGESGSRGGAWVAGQVAFGLVVVGLGLVGPRWPEDVDATLVVVGVLLVAAGAALLVAGGAFLGSSLTPFPRPKRDASMREIGVYRFVRHPMYGGTLVMALGWSFASRPLALVGAFLLGAFLDRKAAQEERWLLEHYPAYEAYRRRTRWRLVPFVR
ncbi:MAG: methyltransferase family protein [Actinomycetota bacterium]